MGMCNLVASLMTCPESQTKLPHLHLPAVWRKKKCSEEHNTWTQSALCFSSEKQLLKSVGREGRFYSMSGQYEVCDSVRWTDDLFYSFPLLPRNVEVLCVRVSARGFRKRNHIGKPSSSVIHVYIGAVVAHLLGAELGSQTDTVQVLLQSKCKKIPTGCWRHARLLLAVVDERGTYSPPPRYFQFKRCRFDSYISPCMHIYICVICFFV